MIKYTIPYHKKTIFRTVITFCLIILSVTSYGQGCPEVPKSILNGANGFSVEGKGAGDDFGTTAKSAGDINHDGIPDVMIGAPGVNFGGLTDVGEIYVIFGKAGLSVTTFDLTTLDGTNGFVIRGVVSNEKLGEMISTAGDLNNDGIDDIIVGDNFATSGTAFVFFGSDTAFLPLYNRTDLNTSNSVVFTADSAMYTKIIDVSTAGDINNDGINDVIVDVDFGFYIHYFIVFGKSGLANLNTSSLNGTNGFLINGYIIPFSGQASTGRNAGDFNNDGIDDLILGIPQYDEGSVDDAGRAIIWYGKNTAFNSLYGLSTMTATDGTVLTNSGTTNSIRLGASVASAGDFNKDGIDDVIIGAPGKMINGLSYVGEAYIVFGRNTSFPASFATNSLNSSNAIIFQGKKQYEQVGSFVNGLKDINKDGSDDIIITIKGGKANNGAVLVVFGGTTATGVLNEDMIFGNKGYQVFNDENYSSSYFFGKNAGAIGDFNLDGTNDFVVSSIGTSYSHNEKGFAYVFYNDKIERTDIIAPTISCPVGQELYANSTLPDYVSYLPGVSDNCTDGLDLIFTQTPPQGTLFTADTNVTITVKDKSGNSNYCSFLVKLRTNSVEINCKTTYLYTDDLNGSNGLTILGEKGFLSLGYSVNTAGDINGDGIADFIIGAPGNRESFQGRYKNEERVIRGTAYLIFGTSVGFPPNIDLKLLNGTNGFAIRNDNPISIYPKMGYDVASAGDLNGDGIGDFMISEPPRDIAANSQAGSVYVIFGRTSGFPAVFFLSTLNGTNGFVLNGVENTGLLGTSIDSVGDINGDGIQDIAAIDIAYGGTNGKCFVVYGSHSAFPAILLTNQLDGTNGFKIEGDAAVGRIGFHVSGLGDINGDGIPDMGIGSANSSDQKRKFIVYGRASNFPATFNVSTLNGSNGFVLENSVTQLNAYSGIAKVGDVNGDGYKDAAIAGEYILFGGTAIPAVMDLKNLDGTNGFKIKNFYIGIAPAKGDFNKDGFDDFLLTINNGFSVVYGKNTWPAIIDADAFTEKDALKIITKYSADDASYAGDVNKDGVDDIILGSALEYYNITVNQPLGFAYVFFGKQIALDTEKPVITNCPTNKVLNIGDAIPNYKTTITVTDNCDIAPVVTQTPVAGTIFTGGIQTITLTATDATSNSATCSFTISSVADTESPTIICPADQLLACGSLLPNYLSLAIVSDNTDPSPTITQSPIAGSPFVPGMTVTIKAKDASNNTKNCSFLVNASADITKPVITCIGNQTLSCDLILPNYIPLITATDNCDASPIITQNPIPGSPFTNGMTVVITAKDASNNEETCSFLVNATDIIKPAITCPGNQTLAFGDALPDYSGSLVVSDNCDALPVITQNPVAGSPFSNGMTVVLSAMDASGNTESCSFIITEIADTELPEIICLADQNVICSTTKIPDYTKFVTVTDNQDANPAITQSPVAGSPFVTGMTITIFVTDASNNTATCNFKVNASADVTKPVITCIGSQSLSCSSILPDYTKMITAADNCDALPTITQNPIPGSPFVNGMTVTITARDASNNIETCSFLVNASADVIKPEIICTGDQTLPASALLPDYRNKVTVSDNCDSNLTVIQNPLPGTSVSDGMIIQMKVSDNSGNESNCSFVIHTITNTDTELPVIACLSDQKVPCNATKVPDYTSMVSVTDNADPNPVIKQSPAAGSVFTDGMTLTITATDASSNQSNCSFKIHSNVLLVDAGDDVEINEGQSIQLEAIATEEGKFKWQPETGISNVLIANPLFFPVETTVYTIFFTNKEGCEVEDSVIISVISQEKDETKYGFSPNNDGINDFWVIDNIAEYPNNKVSIYNAWGDLVFQTTGYNNTTNVFNGIANKKRKLGADELPEGTYFFEINPNSKLHHFKKLKGYLVLKR